MTLANVARIPAVEPEELDRRYLRTGTPVVLTGLYADAPVARLADPVVAHHELAGVALPVRPNVIDEFLQGGPEPPARTATFGALYDDLRTGAASRDFCVEHDTPAELASYLPVPPYVKLHDDDWVSHMFLAGPGNVAHLHYDGDQRHVLMHQVFGRKRYVVVDPSATRKLAPGTRPTVRRTSALFLEHFDDDDLAAFLRYVHAWDCVLEPGETLLIPASAWHYVEYVDVALSVNFRFGRNRYTRALAGAVPVPSVELQALAAVFRDPDAVGPDESAAFEELVAAAAGEYPDPATRVATLDALCVSLCERLGLPIAGPPYHVADIERRRRMQSGAEVTASTVPGTVAPGTLPRSPAPAAPVSPPAPFLPEDAVALVAGADVLVPVTGGGIVLARDGALTAALPPDPAHPWTLGVVARVAREPGLAVAELAAGAGVEAEVVGELLGLLAQAGWLRAPERPEPVAPAPRP